MDAAPLSPTGSVHLLGELTRSHDDDDDEDAFSGLDDFPLETVARSVRHTESGPLSKRRRAVPLTELERSAARLEEALAGSAARARSDEDSDDDERDPRVDAVRAAREVLLGRAVELGAVATGRVRAVERLRVPRNADRGDLLHDVLTLETAAQRCERLARFVESFLSSRAEPFDLLDAAEKETCGWSSADAALAQHPFVARLLSETAHVWCDDAMGAVGGAIALVHIRSGARGGARVPPDPSDSRIQLEMRATMTLVKLAVHPAPHLSFEALHPLAELDTAVQWAAAHHPVARSMVWRACICTLPLLRANPVGAVQALGAALPQLVAELLTPRFGAQVVYDRCFSGDPHLVWAAEYAAAACAAEQTDVRRAEAGVLTAPYPTVGAAPHGGGGDGGGGGGGIDGRV